MALQWYEMNRSTLVESAAYDQAARRIYVRLRSGLAQHYDNCTLEDWELFTARTTSAGDFLTRVLSRKPNGATLPGGPRPPRSAVATRATYLNVFQPAQEIANPRFFAGRRDEIKQLADALQMSGSCPLIYGDRGLGKSSLAMQARSIAMGDAELLIHVGASNLAIPKGQGFISLFVTCTEEVAYLDDLLQLLINAAEAVVPSNEQNMKANQLVDRTTRRKLSFRIFESEVTKTFETDKQRLSHQNLSLSERLQQVVSLLTGTFKAPILFVVDELDKMRDKTGLASLVKALSSEHLKFMLVGIAQNWSDLLLDHASLERRLIPIRVPRMLPPELAQIIDLAVDALADAGSETVFDSAARSKLVEVAGGFPWFVHVIGQAALMRAFDAGDTTVTAAHVTRSIRDLVENRFAHQFADAYQRAVRDSVNREITLRALAEWRTTDIPTRSVYPMLQSLGVSNPAVYRGHLTREDYGSVIMTPGYQDRGLVRFRNEMFKQYVYMVPSLYPGIDERVRHAMGIV